MPQARSSCPPGAASMAPRWRPSATRMRAPIRGWAAVVDEATAQLVQDAHASMGDHSDGATLFRELTRRNTRGPAMHRIDRLVVDTSAGAVPVLAYVPVPVPSGVILLLDRGPHEG